MQSSDFTYPLTEDRIAQIPVEPRDSSRLLDSRTMSDHVFSDLSSLLRAGDLMVVNETRVRHARLSGTKLDTGGAVEVLLLGERADGSWEAMIKPSRRIRPGSILDLAGIKAEVVAGPDDGIVRLNLEADVDIETALAGVGQVPLPPYISTPLADPARYQTVYARRPGSAAAPTAGLHFTDAVLSALSLSGIEIAAVELQVGIATFRPIATDLVEDHVMHHEVYRIPAETATAVQACRKRGGRVVAIGTTSVRALESAAAENGGVAPGSGSTDLFLMPGSPISVVDLLVTNFHLPGSTLLVMLEAFMGPSWKTVYQTALERRYRFLSFGDAMLCERPR